MDDNNPKIDDNNDTKIPNRFDEFSNSKDISENSNTCSEKSDITQNSDINPNVVISDINISKVPNSSDLSEISNPVTENPQNPVSSSGMNEITSDTLNTSKVSQTTKNNNLGLLFPKKKQIPLKSGKNTQKLFDNKPSVSRKTEEIIDSIANKGFLKETYDKNTKKRKLREKNPDDSPVTPESKRQATDDGFVCSDDGYPNSVQSVPLTQC